MAQERVPELVRAFLGDEHAGVGGRPRRHPGPVGREPGCVDEPGARRPRADDRRDRDQVPGVVIERHESRQHQVAERRGDALGSSGRHQFLDEQRVPVGVARDPVEVGGRGCVAQQDRRDLGRRRRGEPLQDDAVGREATELRDEVSFGAAVLGPEGGNEQHRDPAQVGGDVAQEVPARGIDPVHVVDDEDEPAAARDVPEQIRDGIEEELLPVLRGCPGQVDGRQRRDQPGELWSDIAGEFADDCVRRGCRAATRGRRSRAHRAPRRHNPHERPVPRAPGPRIPRAGGSSRCRPRRSRAPVRPAAGSRVRGRPTAGATSRRARSDEVCAHDPPRPGIVRRNGVEAPICARSTTLRELSG